MFCILHIYGTDLQADRFLIDVALSHCKVLHKGACLSGTDIIVSVSDKEHFAGQIEDAITFLRSNQDSIERLLKYPGVEEVCINFNIDPNQPPDNRIFPSELHEMAVNRGISLNILERIKGVRSQDMWMPSAIGH